MSEVAARILALGAEGLGRAEIAVALVMTRARLAAMAAEDAGLAEASEGILPGWGGGRKARSETRSLYTPRHEELLTWKSSCA